MPLDALQRRRGGGARGDGRVVERPERVHAHLELPRKVRLAGGEAGARLRPGALEGPEVRNVEREARQHLRLPHEQRGAEAQPLHRALGAAFHAAPQKVSDGGPPDAVVAAAAIVGAVLRAALGAVLGAVLGAARHLIQQRIHVRVKARRVPAAQ